MLLKDFLKKRRKSLHLTQKDVADHCGVSIATVSRWETGTIEEMRRPRIQLLAEVLQVSPAELVFDDIDLAVLVNADRTPSLNAVPSLGGKQSTLTMANNADFTLTAKDDLMRADGIPQGSIVFFDTKAKVKNGDIVAAVVCDQKIIRRYYNYGGTVVLRNAANREDEYKLEKPARNALQIVGRATAVLAPLIEEV